MFFFNFLKKSNNPPPQRNKQMIKLHSIKSKEDKGENSLIISQSCPSNSDGHSVIIIRIWQEKFCCILKTLYDNNIFTSVNPPFQTIVIYLQECINNMRDITKYNDASAIIVTASNIITPCSDYRQENQMYNDRIIFL